MATGLTALTTAVTDLTAAVSTETASLHQSQLQQRKAKTNPEPL